MSSCYQLMVDRCKKDGKIVYYNHKVPMSQFLKDVDGFAAGLQSLGLQKGDVVTVFLPTCVQSVVAFYACSKMGYIASFVHPVTPVAELKENLIKTNSKVLLFYDVLIKDEKVLADTDVTLVRCSICDYVNVRKPVYKLYVDFFAKRLRKAVKYSKLVQTKNDTENVGEGQDIVCYMHSGGTSGQAKIVMLSNNAFNGCATTIIDMYNHTFDKDDFYLCALPVFHAYGLCNAVHTGLLATCNLVLLPKFDIKAVNAYCNKYQVTAWAVVPAMLFKMLKNNSFDCKHLSKLDVIWCGGDTVSEELVENIDGIIRKHGSRAKVMRGYGLTETCGVCAVNNFDDYAKNSCGKPIEGCEVEIWDDDGKVLPKNTLGEIVLTTRGLMSGYLDGGESWEKDKTWIRTGDVGYLDKEGFLYVVDRKKRSVKIAAVNVFPSQIEACIKKLPFIEEVCVVPYRINNKQYLKAFVTLKSKMAKDKVKEEVINVCKRNLIRYSVPSEVVVLNVMPRTKLAKIDYKKLEKM